MSATGLISFYRVSNWTDIIRIMPATGLISFYRVSDWTDIIRIVSATGLISFVSCQQLDWYHSYRVSDCTDIIRIVSATRQILFVSCQRLDWYHSYRVSDWTDIIRIMSATGLDWTAESSTKYFTPHSSAQGKSPCVSLAKLKTVLYSWQLLVGQRQYKRNALWQILDKKLLRKGASIQWYLG